MYDININMSDLRLLRLAGLPSSVLALCIRRCDIFFRGGVNNLSYSN